MAHILFPLFAASTDRILIPPIHSPRATQPEKILALAVAQNPRAALAPSAAQALATAIALTPPNGLIVAAGSIYLLGELRAALAVS
jgi:dihydrofolate synthase/folylpolyglutamate synthase